MWLELILAMAISADLPASGQSNPAPLPPPIPTRQTAFSIPFRVERAPQPAQDPTEVQLYVSTDMGASWRLYSRVDPRQGRFVFRAGGDGEFWFVIRTVDRSGQIRPQGNARPGLRVIVDTAPPKLLLEARGSEGGRISARWRVEDPHLNPESLKIQYRTAPTQPWQPVAIDRQPGGGASQSGEASWLAQGATGRAEIRAEVVDAAGNPAVSHAQVELAGSSMAGSASPVSIQINPAMRRQYGASTEPGGNGIGPMLPLGVRPRMVNARVFELEYNVDSVGPSGIAKVELWGTRDGGRTWSSFGKDADKRSPMIATVNEDGVYGFCVCVQNGVGLGGGPPQPGQKPDLWIGVDRAKPEVRLISAEQGTGEQSGRLLIAWEARDWMLAVQPISLFHGETMGGPWTPIATGLENTGQYSWLVDPRVPERIYLRLEARDEAGNLGIYETPKPVLLDKLRPSVHIRDVRPIGLLPQPERRRF